MGRIKKSTRKFEKNHLKDTLERRKDFAKIKQRNQIKAKKKAKNTKESGDGRACATNGKGATEGTKTNGVEEILFEDMSVDDFFKGGFRVPESKGGKAIGTQGVDAKTEKRRRIEPEDRSDGSFSTSGYASAGEDFDTHKEDLNALAKKDPEFYNYLKKNDAELLDFAEGSGDNLVEVGALSDSEVDDPPKKKRRKLRKDTALDGEDGDGTEVTAALVMKWRTALIENNSLRAMRQVVLAFRAAAHVNEDDGKEYKYTISDPDVYNDLLILALKHIPEVLNQHLPAKETNSGKIRVPTESRKYQTLTPLLKSYTSSVLHLLTALSDAPTLKLTLSSLIPLIQHIFSFKKLLRSLVRAVVNIWSDPSGPEATRITAFLVIRKIAVMGDSGIREDTLRIAYQGLVKGSRVTTMHTLQGINLMKNSASELWGLDQTVGYTTGFSFIRQLAIHLRASITNNSKVCQNVIILPRHRLKNPQESYKTVYNWQYVHSLDFWSRVLSAYCDPLKEAQTAKESPLRPLIYPLVQVTLGVMRLIPTAQYFPLRFQLTRALLRLSCATGTYIPLAPTLVEVLSSTEMKKKPKSTTLKPLDFSTTIRAPKSYLRTRVYQDGLGEQVVELLSEFFMLWAKSIAFPELALPVNVMLKRWLRQASGTSVKGKTEKIAGNRNRKANAMIGLLVQKLEANARWVEDRRAKVDYALSNRACVDGFLRGEEWEKTPLGAFVMGQRKSRAEKERLVEEGRREEERKKKGIREDEGWDEDEETDEANERSAEEGSGDDERGM
ncbi:MAG: Nucleolar Complex 2 protein [Trichoglossum hirsutum]|nr:MAG: Nucleolar Complex 2 protein [Trichoglossum hirsutum]